MNTSTDASHVSCEEHLPPLARPIPQRPGLTLHTLLSSWSSPGSVRPRAKRAAQCDLPCELDPKDKEHQRKKILRNFLTYKSRQVGLSDTEIKFWAWVRSINPDNSASEYRFKSMSYEFLDKLLEKRMFRDEFSFWLSKYEASLGSGEDEEKTLMFIKFVKNLVSVKLYLDRFKTELLASQTPLDIDTMPKGAFAMTPQPQREIPGLYIEQRCKQRDCVCYNTKACYYVGGKGAFKYNEIVEKSRCQECGKTATVVDVGFTNCRWRYAGELKDEKTLSGAEAIAW